MGFMVSVAIKAPMWQINLGYMFRLKLLTSRSHILIGIGVEYQNQWDYVQALEQMTLGPTIPRHQRQVKVSHTASGKHEKECYIQLVEALPCVFKKTRVVLQCSASAAPPPSRAWWWVVRLDRYRGRRRTRRSGSCADEEAVADGSHGSASNSGVDGSETVVGVRLDPGFVGAGGSGAMALTFHSRIRHPLSVHYPGNVRKPLVG